MASRVNIKFVIGLGVFLLAVVGGVGFFGLRAINAGGQQNIERGDKAMAEGKTAEAVNFYGRAVNKDRGNADWIRKWIGAMEKTTPPTRQAYEDAYIGQYLAALRALVEADRKDATSFKRYLNERYHVILYRHSSLAGWEAFAKEYKEVDRLYSGDKAGRDSFRRFNGLARLMMLGFSAELPQSEIDAGIEDLTAALVADPADEEAAIGIVSFLHSSGQRAEKAGRSAEAAKFAADAKARLDDFARKYPDSVRVHHALLQKDLSDYAKSHKDADALTVLQASKPRFTQVIEKIMAAPGDRTDVSIAVRMAALAPAIMEDGQKVSQDLLTHARKRSGDLPYYLLSWANLEKERGGAKGMDAAMELAREVSAMPDKPMSLDGLLLHTWRAEALRLQVDALFVRWESETDVAKRDAVVKSIKDLRAELAGRVGETAPAIQSIDGRLMVLAGDTLGARTVISAYNDQTRRSDPVMLMIEAQLLSRLNQQGAAKSTYEDVLKIRPNNVTALRALAMIEADMLDYKSAAEHFRLASGLLPEDTQLRELAKNAATLASQQFAADPVIQAIVEASELAKGLAGDVKAGITRLKSARKDYPKDIRLAVHLANYQYVNGQTDEAKKTLDEAIAAHPEERGLIEARRSLETDPLPALLAMIDKTVATEVQKNLARFQVHNRYGKPEDAARFLAEAARLAPEDPQVVDFQFDHAVLTRNVAEIDRLAGVAKAKDLDRFGGQLYQARALMFKGNAQEAVGLLRDVTFKDKRNLLAWRLLGQALLLTNQSVAATDALKTAVSIRPDDLPSVTAYIRALIDIDAFAEALDFARRTEKFCGACAADRDFVEMHLILEERAPGGDRARVFADRKSIKENYPDNRSNKTTLASMYVQDARWDDARTLIDDLRKSDPDDISALQLEASLIAKMGDVAGGVKLIQDHIAKLPPEKRKEELYINGARMLVILGQPDQALLMLDGARSIQDPKTALIDREIGDMAFDLSTAPGTAKAVTLARLKISLEAYQRVLDGGGEDTNNAVRKRMIEACLKGEQFDEMNRLFGRLPESVKGDPTILLLLAEAASYQNDREKALRLYDQAVAADPKNAIAYVKRGDYKLSLERFQDAETDYEQVVRVEPGSVLGRFRLARIYTITGRDEQSVQILKEIISLDPFNENWRRVLMQRLLELNRPREAADACRDAYQAFNKTLPWTMLTAQYYASAENWEACARYAAEVWIDHRRREPQVAILFVEALLKTKNVSAAFNLFREPSVAAELDKNLALRLLHARMLAQQGQMGEAAQGIADALRLVRPEVLQDATLFLSGVQGIYEKQADQIAALGKLEARAPFTGYLAVRVAELRIRDPAHKTSAIAALEALIPVTTDNKIKAAAWSLLGTTYYNDKLWKEAHERYVKGMELDPDNIELNNNLAYILAVRLGRCDEALAYAQKANSRTSVPISGFLDTLGAAQLCAKKCEDAVRTLNRGLQAALNDSERIPVYIHLAHAHLCQGDKPQARMLANRAREIMLAQPSLRDSYDADWKDLEKAIDAK